jgi:hypothetical protein
MSANWRYISNKLTNILKSIELSEKLQANPPIYKWTIRFSNGHLMDLYNKDIINIKDLTKDDKRALYEALKNDEELKKKGYEEVKTKVF